MRTALVGLLSSACSFHALELPDGSAGPGGDALPPACADMLEPNNTTTMPTVVSFDNGLVVSYAGLTLCPANDQDVFFVPVEGPGTALHVAATRQLGVLELVLLTMNGTTLVVGTDVADRTELCVPNLPMGLYFVAISEGVDTRYSLKIELAATCN